MGIWRERASARGLPLLSPSMCEVCVCKPRALHAFCLIAHVHIRELQPWFVFVSVFDNTVRPRCHVSQHAHTEYSSAGSGHLYLIVCWVIYSEPARHGVRCVPSLLLYPPAWVHTCSPAAPPPPLHTQREAIAKHIGP